MIELWVFVDSLEYELLIGSAGLLCGIGFMLVGLFRLTESGKIERARLKEERKSWNKVPDSSATITIQTYSLLNKNPPITSIFSSPPKPQPPLSARSQTTIISNEKLPLQNSKPIKEKFNHKVIFTKARTKNILKPNHPKTIASPVPLQVESSQQIPGKYNEFEIINFINQKRDQGAIIKEYVPLIDIVDYREFIFPFNPNRKQLERHRFAYVLMHDNNKNPQLAFTLGHKYKQKYIDLVTNILKEKKIAHHFT